MRIEIIVARNQKGTLAEPGKPAPWGSLPSHDTRALGLIRQNDSVILTPELLESLPDTDPLLKGRTCFVVADWDYRPQRDNTIVIFSLANVWAYGKRATDVAYVLGGARLFAEAKRYATKAHVTLVDDHTIGATHFELTGSWRLDSYSPFRKHNSQDALRSRLEVWVR